VAERENLANRGNRLSRSALKDTAVALTVAAGSVLLAAAVAAALMGWHAEEMRTIATSIGLVVMVAAVGLYSTQAHQRRASDTALRNVQARVGGIVESAMDAIITVDQSQHIVLFNAAAEHVFGCPRDEAIGAPLAWFIPERYRKSHPDHVRRFGETGSTSRRMGAQRIVMGAQRIVMGLRRNGEEFPIEASISQTTEHGHIFFTVILRDVTARVRAEQDLRASKDELRELASAAHTVREQEKSRIARELHDELAQSLTSLKMDVVAAREELSPQQQSLCAKMVAMQENLDAMVAATRRIAADLRPLMLDDLGLVPAAEWLAESFTQRTGIRCAFSVDPPELDLQEPHATAIFRILQESLTNVARHARATLVEVTLDGSGEDVVLRVRDNGRGFDPAAPRKAASLGLVGLRERTSLLGGEITIEAAPGRGTVIAVHMPLQSTVAAA